MEFSEKEQKLLERMKEGELDGILSEEIHWKSRGQVCRMLIIGGIPCFVSIMDSQYVCYPRVVVEQYYETDEMKLWFLKMHGWKMSDPDVLEYYNDQ